MMSIPDKSKRQAFPADGMSYYPLDLKVDQERSSSLEAFKGGSTR